MWSNDGLKYRENMLSTHYLGEEGNWGMEWTTYLFMNTVSIVTIGHIPSVPQGGGGGKKTKKKKKKTPKKQKWGYFLKKKGKRVI